MTDEPREIDASCYSCAGGHVFDDMQGPWDATPISTYFEWTTDDGQSGPIRDGVVIGGPADGLRIAPPAPKLPFEIDPGQVTVKFYTGGST